MIFQGFKYLDWEAVNQAAQSIRETACQCEIHCISIWKRKTTKNKSRKQTKAKFQTELEVHVMRGYLQRR